MLGGATLAPWRTGHAPMAAIFGGAIGIRAPSLYKHFPDKTPVAAALMDEGFIEITRRFNAALSAEMPSLWTLQPRTAFSPASARTCIGPSPRERCHATADGPASRSRPPRLSCMSPAIRASRGVWVFANGMTIMELDGRFPPDADRDAAWRAGVDAFPDTARESQPAGPGGPLVAPDSPHAAL